MLQIQIHGAHTTALMTIEHTIDGQSKIAKVGCCQQIITWGADHTLSSWLNVCLKTSSNFLSMNENVSLHR